MDQQFQQLYQEYSQLDIESAIDQQFTTANDLKAQYNLSFDLHFNLITIHPWIDGNGRTARFILMP
jgi:Fic family protein